MQINTAASEPPVISDLSLIPRVGLRREVKTSIPSCWFKVFSWIRELSRGLQLLTPESSPVCIYGYDSSVGSRARYRSWIDQWFCSCWLWRCDLPSKVSSAWGGTWSGHWSSCLSQDHDSDSSGAVRVRTSRMNLGIWLLFSGSWFRHGQFVLKALPPCTAEIAMDGVAILKRNVR